VQPGCEIVGAEMALLRENLGDDDSALGRQPQIGLCETRSNFGWDSSHG
jgi:hypothetical protein